MRSACRDLVSQRILEPGAPAGAGASPAPEMMVYPDPQWTCTATAPMLQLYDDVGYRGEYRHWTCRRNGRMTEETSTVGQTKKRRIELSDIHIIVCMLHVHDM